MIAAIWRQLTEVHDLPIEEAESLYLRHTRQQTVLLLDEVITLTREVVKGKTRALFVIDALDEFPENDKNQATFIRGLQSLLARDSSARCHVQLMVTSRLHDSPFDTSVQVPICATSEDMAKYVTGRLSDKSAFRKKVAEALGTDKALLTNSVDTIVQHSGQIWDQYVT